MDRPRHQSAEECRGASASSYANRSTERGDQTKTQRGGRGGVGSWRLGEEKPAKANTVNDGRQSAGGKAIARKTGESGIHTVFVRHGLDQHPGYLRSAHGLTERVAAGGSQHVSVLSGGCSGSQPLSP